MKTRRIVPTDAQRIEAGEARVEALYQQNPSVDPGAVEENLYDLGQRQPAQDADPADILNYLRAMADMIIACAD